MYTVYLGQLGHLDKGKPVTKKLLSLETLVTQNH